MQLFLYTPTLYQFLLNSSCEGYITENNCPVQFIGASSASGFMNLLNASQVIDILDISADTLVWPVLLPSSFEEYSVPDVSNGECESVGAYQSKHVKSSHILFLTVFQLQFIGIGTLPAFCSAGFCGTYASPFGCSCDFFCAYYSDCCWDACCA